jgi:hypothetical protein
VLRGESCGQLSNPSRFNIGPKMIDVPESSHWKDTLASRPQKGNTYGPGRLTSFVPLRVGLKRILGRFFGDCGQTSGFARIEAWRGGVGIWMATRGREGGVRVVRRTAAATSSSSCIMESDMIEVEVLSDNTWPYRQSCQRGKKFSRVRETECPRYGSSEERFKSC